MKFILVSLILVCSVFSQGNFQNVQDVQSCIDSVVDLEKILNQFYTLVRQGKFNDAAALIPDIKDAITKAEDECGFDLVNLHSNGDFEKCSDSIKDFEIELIQFLLFVDEGKFDEAAKIIPYFKKTIDDIENYCRWNEKKLFEYKEVESTTDCLKDVAELIKDGNDLKKATEAKDWAQVSILTAKVIDDSVKVNKDCKKSSEFSDKVDDLKKCLQDVEAELDVIEKIEKAYNDSDWVNLIKLLPGFISTSQKTAADCKKVVNPTF